MAAWAMFAVGAKIAAHEDPIAQCTQLGIAEAERNLLTKLATHVIGDPFVKVANQVVDPLPGSAVRVAAGHGQKPRILVELWAVEMGLKTEVSLGAKDAGREVFLVNIAKFGLFRGSVGEVALCAASGEPLAGATEAFLRF